MTNDGQNGTQTQYLAPQAKDGRTEANLATVDRPASRANDGRTNWAWASGSSSYDWMDSHPLVTDLA
ncbi:hypothetical protein B0G69_2811 [Paraburkholderia sp. RAU2J]|nr:hypothetical protein B0G69_2811 [Paraburkholderia sp. RAU2J]